MISLPDRLVTLREAAEVLSVSERTLWNRIKAGQLRATRIGRRVLFHPQDILAFVESCRGVAVQANHANPPNGESVQPHRDLI